MDGNLAAVAHMVLGGMATAAGRYLWQRLIVVPRQRPHSVREMRDLIDLAAVELDKRRAADRGSQEHRIEEILRLVTELRTDYETDRAAINGKLDAHGRILKRLQTEADFGD